MMQSGSCRTIRKSFLQLSTFIIYVLFLPLQIDKLLRSSKIPIIVGGTNYYIESILWHNLVSPGIGKRKRVESEVDAISELSDEARKFISDSSIVEKMNEMDSATLHEYLRLIDPTYANRVHPNNKRKIIR